MQVASAPEKTNMSKIATHRNKNIQPLKLQTEHVHGYSTYQVKKGPARVAVTFEEGLIHLRMANWAEACSVCLQYGEKI
jgi:hypothetical protein